MSLKKQWQVFMDGTVNDRGQRVENSVMHRQPVQLSESVGELLRPRHLRSVGSNPKICVGGSPAKGLLQQSNSGRIRETACCE